MRFAAYGWHVTQVPDGNDVAALDRAFVEAKADATRPSLIIVRTHIAYGSPNKQDTAAAHGAALGEEEVLLTKRNLEWPSETAFYVPDEALNRWRGCIARGAKYRATWEERYARYREAHEQEAVELDRRLDGRLPANWMDALPHIDGDAAAATRNASGSALNGLCNVLPELIGGSADLAGSVKTQLKGLPAFSRDEPAGRNVSFGVREHAMGSVMNGLALHGGVRPFGGTFLIFSDYMRPAIRLAAMMRLRTIYLFSHDSIGVGEDGPTHQPIETLAALRAIPGLTVIRPADAREMVQAWSVAVALDGPVAIVSTRQDIPSITRSPDPSLGGYVLLDPPQGDPEAIVIASGSETSLAVEAHRRLTDRGRRVRVVNMPSMELFAAQDPEYQESVLPARVAARVAVEAAHPMPWYRWVGPHGRIIGLDRFGESGPYKQVFVSLGITVDAVVKAVTSILE